MNIENIERANRLLELINKNKKILIKIQNLIDENRLCISLENSGSNVAAQFGLWEDSNKEVVIETYNILKKHLEYQIIKWEREIEKL